MTSKIKKNIFIITIITITLVSLIYCSKNTFIINDDLPYSFFHRTDIRITNIKQVIGNQISDYKNISPRVFIHFIAQYLLIYGKKLWSIINPVIIILTALIMTKIIKISSKKDNYNLSILLTISLFLSMITYKKIIYWVAGSVNYVWTSVYLLFLIYIYLKKGYSNKKIINLLLILSISILHEYLLVFSIIFVITNYIINAYKQKKIIMSDIIYIIPLIISYIFLLKAPSSQIRINLSSTWNNMTIIEKLLTSIPEVSRNFIFNSNKNNYIIIFYIICLLIYFIKSKLKYKSIIIFITILLTIISIVTDNGWLYFILSLLLLISSIYYLLKTSKNKLIPVLISMYGIVFSMVITPEYNNYRSNYVVYLFLIVLSIIIIYDSINKQTLKKTIPIFTIFFIILIANEIYSYTIIGNIHKERINNINNCINTNCEVLKIKKIPLKYEFYHMDINSPQDKNYFAYDSFINYYHLDKNIQIIYYK